MNLYAPTDKIPNRPLLTKYINQYTARNSRDYFIHKDLGSFLKRELDFYIKNEVMRLDDIDNADAPAVESYLAKIKVMRKIATKLIDFLAQLEDFQKKLWLKKKFVTETNYCITLDRVPEALYGEIAANDAQREEWVKLFAIDEIGVTQEGAEKKDKELFEEETISYSVPLTVEFLKANDKLVLDTAFFSDEFKAKLIESIEDFDEQCDGLLIHSENFQALRLLQEKYREKVKCVYIDPPYNTEANAILYKNSYKHSSWLSMIHDRIKLSQSFELKNIGIHIIAIDDAEQTKLHEILPLVFVQKTIKNVTVIHNPGGTIGKNFSDTGEYAIFVFDDKKRVISMERRDENPDIRDLMNTAKGKTSNYLRSSGKTCFYPILVKDMRILGYGNICQDNFHPKSRNIKKDDGTIEVYPIDNEGVERKWVLGHETIKDFLHQLTPIIDRKNGEVRIQRSKDEINYKTVWTNTEYSAKKYGTELLGNIVPITKILPPLYPKSIHLVSNCLFAGLNNISDGIILDYFAGSGTTGHAVIGLNREDNLKISDSGNRKYILVEMGYYFNTVTKPRITKVIYSSEWKNGKPTSRNTGISQCFKYIRLESYEDTLNNLEFDDNPDRSRAIESNPSLKEDFMLHYLLNVETRGSQSLLNIDAFTNPTAYTLKVKKPGSDEQVVKQIDLIETFNYLIGLHLENMAAPQTFTASFSRKEDSELPDDQHTKLVVDGKIQLDDDGKWWFRKVEGWVPADRMNPNNGIKERVLIVWRKLTGNLEEDNLMLDEWFEKYRISTRDFEYDTIYVNGSNNLPNLRKDDENWKVRLIEEEFHKRMWDIEGEA